MRKLAVAALVFSASPVFADPGPGFAIGARVGGYGFRREQTMSSGGVTGVSIEENKKWDECRMNGFGIFGNRDLRGPLFVEAGLDMYGSIGATQSSDLPLDRTSGLVSGAIGARTQVTSWLGGYVQLGGGVELTSVSVPYGDTRIRDHKAMPEGFFGIGVDFRIAKGTHIGSNIRTLLMGNFDYDPSRLDMEQGWIAAPSKDDVFDASPDVAAQAQFYLRREL